MLPNAALAADKTTATINDDNDAAPQVGITGTPVVTEGVGAEFVVSLDRMSGKTVTVTYATGDAADTAQPPGDYTAVSGTELTFTAGQTAKTVTIATTNDDLDEDAETFTVTLRAPDNATLAADKTTATGTINDDNDAAPQVGITGPPAVTEGAGAEFVVSLNAASGKTVTVTYATGDDTAKAGADYTEVPGTELTFTAGQTEQTITIATLDDQLDEEAETFSVTLSGPDNATLAADKTTATGTINDDNDAAPQVGITGPPAVTEGTGAEFVVSLNAASGKTVTVTYATGDAADTAEADADYTEELGTELTFTAGQTEQTITIATKDDTLNEAEETFTVTLSSPSNASLDHDDASGTITDNDALIAAVTADAENLTVAEGESALFTVTLTEAMSTADVLVNYSLIGSATEPDDYTAPSGTLTIDAGFGSGKIAIDTKTDDVLDKGETLEVQLLDDATSAGDVTVNTEDTAVMTITDSGEVTVSVKAVTVQDDANTPEDESEDKSIVEEGTAASFAVELSGSVGTVVEVQLATSDGSAQAGADKDYTETIGTLTFSTTQTSKTVEVPTRIDGLNERDETFTVELTAPTLPDGVSLNTLASSATGTITDNDTLTATVTGANSVTEGESALFTVTLTEATSTANVVVNYSLIGSATAPDDYTAPSGTLTIGAEHGSGKITIDTEMDDVLDRGETLEVQLDDATSAGAVTVNTKDTAVTTITDSGEVKFSVKAAMVEEGDPPVQVNKSSVEEGDPASFVIELSGAVEKTVEVSYATSDGTGNDAAAAGTDYTAADATLIFSSKETSKTVTVTTTEDTLNEADETFTVTITGVTLPDGVTRDGSKSTATGTIEDDDALTATVTAKAENVPEGNAAEFIVELTEDITSTADVKVTYTWASTGTAGTDYTAPNGLLTIGIPNASGTISIATLTDEVLDPGETLSVTLTTATTTTGTASVGTPATATTTIAQEGTVTVSVKAETVEDDDTTPEDEEEDKSVVEEGGSASFVVELSGAVASAVEVSYTTSNDTAEAGTNEAGDDKDYRTASGTLTFTPSESLTQTLTVTTTDDDLNEATEEFTVTLTGPNLPDQVDVDMGTSSAQGTITDNDGLTAAITAVETSVDEGNTAEFTVALTGGTSTADVLVTYTVGGSATSGDDYTAPDSTLTIGSGLPTGTIAIETLTDIVAEGNDETLEVTLTGATTSTRTVTIDADKTTATTTINNTTTVTVSLRPPKDTTQSSASRTALVTRSVTEQQTERTATEPTPRSYSSAKCLIGGEVLCPTEGEPVTIPVYLVTTNESGDTVSVTVEGNDMVKMPYETSSGTADADNDYTSKSDTLTFTSTSDHSPLPCESGATCLSLTLETLEDRLNEAREVFTVTLLAAELPDDKTTGVVPIQVPILDDDPIIARVSASPETVTEGESVRFTVTLSGGTSTEPVTIHYEDRGDGTATRDKDYIATAGTLTIGTGLRSGAFTIPTHDDTDVEPPETFEVELTGGSSAGAVIARSSATATITDNDSVTLSVAPAKATEGEPASFVVSLSGAAPDAVEVSYATTDGTGSGAAVADKDYEAASGTLTFSSGETSNTVQVTTLQDDLNEAEETFTLTLTAPDLPPWATLGTAIATGKIEDDDRLTAAVRADAEIVAEGDTAKFTVELTGGTSTEDVVVAYTVAGTAVANDDYTVPDGTLTIGAGESSGTITIVTKTDDVAELDETLRVTLTPNSANSAGAVTVNTTPAITTIIDPPAVSIGDARAAENDGEIFFEVSLSAPSPRQITVDFRTEDGTATARDDYVAVSGSLTFAGGETSGTISVSVLDDALDEADETFAVLLSAPENARLDGDTVSATGTIIDDDDPPALSIADASAKESAGEIAFRVSLDAPSGRTVEVSYRTEDGTAKAGSDYGAKDGTLTVEPGRTAATIPITLQNDTVEEPDETFRVLLSDSLHAELPDDSSATGTIIDDDVSVAQVWLARFGRTVATHVVDAVGERLSEAGVQSSNVALAGHPLQPAPVPAEWQESTPIPFRTLAGHDLVAGSSFRLASSGDEDEAADGGSKWTGWGRGAVTRLAGKEPKADLLLRGTIATGTAGVDYDWGGVLTGLAMAYTGGGGNFKTDEPYLEPRSGTAESWLLSAHPYARVSVVDGLEVWGLLGYGLGMMTLTEDASVNTDIRLMMGAAGVRGILLTPMANGGFGVAVSTDGFAMRANADAAGHQPAVEADAVRGRLLVEGSYDAHLGDGSVLTPMVEAGMRYDAGHAEEGFGAELGGGVRYVKPEWGLTATANGRFVLAHQDLGFQEWGLRGSLQWSPGAGGLGPSLGVNTSVGTAASGVQRLWSQGATPIPAAPDSAGPAGRLDAQLGYGMSVDLLGTNARLTPYAGLTLADGGTQAYRVGGRANLGPAFSLSLQGERRESSGAAPAHGITLSGSLHW